MSNREIYRPSVAYSAIRKIQMEVIALLEIVDNIFGSPSRSEHVTVYV